MRFGIQHFVCVFFALMMMVSISPNTIDRLSGRDENKLAMATRLVKLVGMINDYQEAGASIKHRPAPPGDEVGDKIQDYQEPSLSHKHVPPQPTNEDGLA